MSRAAAAALILLATAAADDTDRLAALAKRWKKLDRDGKQRELMMLGGMRSARLLAQCDQWLEDEDPVARGHVVRVVAGHLADGKLGPRAEQMLGRYIRRHLRRRLQRERKELAAVHRRYKRKVPPADVMAAGANWTDPWDETRRKPPQETLDERLHMREVVAAIEASRHRELRGPLLAIMLEHHDPEVVVRVIRCFQAWEEWRALTALADLVRIQQHGREIGGSHVIGEKAWTELRLKWDVYKDELWWSRPEYLPRTIRPIGEAASAITGAHLGSAREIDAWLLSHPETLKKHGITLSEAFRKRAATTQR